MNPQNPLIPLSSEIGEAPRSSGYFPEEYPPGYFPKEDPVIKFDHPIHPILLPPSSPVLPPPDYGRDRNFGSASSMTESFSKQHGFQPVFIPNNRDKSQGGGVQGRPILNRDYSQITADRAPAFPEIDATIRYENLELETRKPNLDFGAGYTENLSPADINQLYDEYMEAYDLPENVLFSRSTAKPKLTMDVESEEQDYSSEPPTTTMYDPRKTQEAFGHLVPKTVSEKKKEVVDSIMEKKNSLEIYEVSSREPAVVETTENDIKVDVTHKGTPKEEEEVPTEVPQYTYEYVYEYEDEDEEGTSTNRVDIDAPTTTVAASTTATTSSTSETPGPSDTTSSLLSLLSFLNSEKMNGDDDGGSTDSSNVGSSSTDRSSSSSSSSSRRQGPLLPKVPLTPPTPYPPIRTSTGNYIDTNYNQNR